MDKIQEAARLIKASQNCVVFTGAGISTESGIPDFRSPGGLWERVDPMIFSTQTIKNSPQKFYEVGMPVFKEINQAQPNAAHYALAELEAAGEIEAVITQNIDNLHQKAGSENVLEIHGHLRSGTCPSCGLTYDIEKIEEKLVAADLPRCDRCDMTIKIDVVLFGESLPADFDRARELAAASDLLIVVGSSLEVSPANILPELASKQVIINLTPTLFDDQAEVVIEEKAGEVLPEIADIILD